MGPWRFIREQIQPLLDATSRRVAVRGTARRARVRPTGSGKRHQQEQAEIVNDALTPGAISQTRQGEGDFEKEEVEGFEAPRRRREARRKQSALCLCVSGSHF